MLNYADFNLWAVLVAAVASFMTGGLWYGPLFGKAWMTASGLTEADLQKNHPAKVYGGALALQVVVAWALAMLIGGGAGWLGGLHWGLFAGLCFAVTTSGIDDLFEMKPMKLFVINGGYKVLNFSVMGVIIGAWQ